MGTGMAVSNEQLKENLFKSLLKVLRHIFGMGTSQSIIRQIEKDTELGVKDLCERPDLLWGAFHRIFGHASKTIERHVLKDLMNGSHVDEESLTLWSTASK